MTSRWGWPARINYVQTIFIPLVTCTLFEPHDHLVHSSPQWDNASEKAMHYIGRRRSKCHNDSSHITKQYFAANGDRLNSQITKLLHELHFTNTFHDQNLYIFTFKLLLTRSSDMSKFAITT